MNTDDDEIDHHVDNADKTCNDRKTNNRDCADYACDYDYDHDFLICPMLTIYMIYGSIIFAML